MFDESNVDQDNDESEWDDSDPESTSEASKTHHQTRRDKTKSGRPTKKREPKAKQRESDKEDHIAKSDDKSTTPPQPLPVSGLSSLVQPPGASPSTPPVHGQPLPSFLTHLSPSPERAQMKASLSDPLEPDHGSPVGKPSQLSVPSMWTSDSAFPPPVERSYHLEQDDPVQADTDQNVSLQPTSQASVDDLSNSDFLNALDSHVDDGSLVQKQTQSSASRSGWTLDSPFPPPAEQPYRRDELVDDTEPADDLGSKNLKRPRAKSFSPEPLSTQPKSRRLQPRSSPSDF